MIPVLITNRDILGSVQEQIRFFQQIQDAYIVLVDNASTYPPLLEWYNECKKCLFPDVHSYTHAWTTGGCDVIKGAMLPNEIHFLPENNGPRAACQVWPRLRGRFDYYFMSDADMDYSDCDPKAFFSTLIAGLERYPVQGAGVSICIDDLPDTKLTRLVREEEAKNWLHVSFRSTGQGLGRADGTYLANDPNWFKAGCDTAGVLRRVTPGWDGGYDGIRSCQLVARHRPWYFADKSTHVCPVCDCPISIWGGSKTCVGCRTAIPLPPDFRYFYEHADPSGTTYTAFVLDKGRNS